MSLSLPAGFAAGTGFDPASGAICDQRWAHGVPLGGIGDGKIELLTDGSFGNFTINNNWDKPCGRCPGAFAAVRAQAGSNPPVVRMLRLQGAGEYAGVVNVAHTRMQGWFPRGEVQFADSSLPVRVFLDAFAPLIPHDLKDSSLPVVCLTYSLTNLSRQNVAATLLLAWPNLLGTGGLGASDNHPTWNDFTGNSQSVLVANGLAGLSYTTAQNYSGQQRQNVVGEYYVGVRADPGAAITLCTNWDAALTPTFWRSFERDGSLPATSGAAQPAGAVAAQVNLPPGQGRSLHFYIVWYMPHLVTQMQNIVSFVPASPGLTNIESRWTTGAPQRPGDNLVIDLGQPCQFQQLTCTLGRYATDYPRGLRVEISADQAHWAPVAALTATEVLAALDQGGGNNVTITLPPNRARYLRLTELGSDPFYWWSIEHLQIAVRDQLAPLTLVPVKHPAPAIDHGRYYCNWFHSAADIAAYVDGRADSLRQQTAAWQLPVQNSNLPYWLRLNLINCAFPTVANSVLTKDGVFSVLEAPVSQGGQLGTMDQRMASHAFTMTFFPELDRAELELFASEQQPDGSIPHCDGNVYDAIASPNVPYGLTGWPDLCCSWVMQSVKMFRWTGDTAFLQRMQPHIDRAMNYLAKGHRGRDPVPQGGSTYDYIPLPDNGAGAFSYTAFCYLGALEAAAASAACSGDTAAAKLYLDRKTEIQNAVMTDLWNRTCLRKFNSPLYGHAIDNSFIATLAGDWLARQMGLPRTMSAGFLRQENEQIIRQHLKPFYPVPPMEVTPDGRRTCYRCFLLQDVPYVGCESIYQGFVDDGLDVLRRTYQCAWEINENPWYEDLGYNDPEGTPEGYTSYMTSPSAWHVFNALSGVSLNIPEGILYVSPRLPSAMKELHLPLFFPRFWAQFDYVPTTARLTLTITKVFADEPGVEDTLYHAPGPSGCGATNPIVISTIAADGDGPLIALPDAFRVQPGAVLDLSAYSRMLVPGPGQTIPSGESTPIGKTVRLRSVTNQHWVAAGKTGARLLAADQSAPRFEPGNPQLFSIIDRTNGCVALQAVASGKYVALENTDGGPLVARHSEIGLPETFLLILDGPGRLALRSLNSRKYVAINGRGATLIADRPGFPAGATIGQIEQNEADSGEIFDWADAAAQPPPASAPPISPTAPWGTGQHIFVK